MAAKKPRKAEKSKKSSRATTVKVKTRRAKEAGKPPEREVGEYTAGSVKINQDELAAFIKELAAGGNLNPYIRFVARNAPFMRRPRIPPA